MRRFYIYLFNESVVTIVIIQNNGFNLAFNELIMFVNKIK